MAAIGSRLFILAGPVTLQWPLEAPAATWTLPAFAVPSFPTLQSTQASVRPSRTSTDVQVWGHPASRPCQHHYPGRMQCRATLSNILRRAFAGPGKAPAGATFGDYETLILVDILWGTGRRLNPLGPPCQSRLGRVTPVPLLSQSRPHGDSMKLNNTVVTLALVGVLALAALAGGLLPAGNVVHAADPEFDSDTFSRRVDENTPPGVNIGAPISATDDDEDGENNNDIEFGDTLTYSLSGTDAASFDIDASTGQLITKAALDTETKGTYEVTVTVDDGETRDAAITQPVGITVTGVDEEPGVPAAPTVVATDTNAADFELKVIWYEPDDTGDGLTGGSSGYDVDYKRSTETSFGSANVGSFRHGHNCHDNRPRRRHVLPGADTGTDVDGDDGPWSLSSAGSTNKEDNNLPTFAEETVARNVLENAEPGAGRRLRGERHGHRQRPPSDLSAPGSGRRLVRPALDVRADTDEEGRCLRLRDKARALCDGDGL